VIELGELLVGRGSVGVGIYSLNRLDYPHSCVCESQPHRLRESGIPRSKFPNNYFCTSYVGTNCCQLYLRILDCFYHWIVFEIQNHKMRIRNRREPEFKPVTDLRLRQETTYCRNDAEMDFQAHQKLISRAQYFLSKDLITIQRLRNQLYIILFNGVPIIMFLLEKMKSNSSIYPGFCTIYWFLWFLHLLLVSVLSTYIFNT
jgi:hypothetical protein